MGSLWEDTPRLTDGEGAAHAALLVHDHLAFHTAGKEAAACGSRAKMRAGARRAPIVAWPASVIKAEYAPDAPECRRVVYAHARVMAMPSHPDPSPRHARRIMSVIAVRMEVEEKAPLIPCTTLSAIKATIRTW